ncbi:MAG: TetR/AcrR family transcriptional regulator [Bifidobacteriaceae bacterium]|jgi:AcrR family transcriptional regulator|nr:TetR/AcrR family transcriptional regulator [Bifidobacteriaceae bacterium]
MTRTNNSQRTITAIVDVAGRLFALRGYEQTTIQDIVDGLGMSKGAIFHHFGSKEEIVEAVLARHSVKLIAAADAVASDTSIPAEERLVRTAKALHVSDDDGLRMVEHLHKPQNALMHLKMERLLLDDAAPILARVVQDGVEQGVFDTPYPQEVTEMILAYSNSAFDAGHLAAFTVDELAHKARSFIWAIERLLGAKDGSLSGLIRMFDGLDQPDGRDGGE